MTGQIKSNYTPFEFSTDTTKTILISEFQLDSLKYEILYYKDILEQTKRNYLVSQKTNFIDTVASNIDSLVVNYYTIGRVLLFKKTFEYRNIDKGSYFLNEYYYLNDGKISYSSRFIVSEKNVFELSENKKEELGSIKLLQSRFRYVYNTTGILSKVVAEFRIGGGGIRLTEYTNDRDIDHQDYRRFPRRKISIWEFWD